MTRLERVATPLPRHRLAAVGARAGRRRPRDQSRDDRRGRRADGAERLSRAGLRIPAAAATTTQHRDRHRRGVVEPIPRRRSDAARSDCAVGAGARRRRVAIEPEQCRTTAGRSFALHPNLALAEDAVRRRTRRRRRQRRAADRADDQGAVHQRTACRGRPSCSPTTTSSRPGRRTRRRGLATAGAVAWATCWPAATRHRSSPACRCRATRSVLPAVRRSSIR